ncbi:MAG: DUF3471 domain-containing protein [Cellulophaga sp.]
MKKTNLLGNSCKNESKSLFSVKFVYFLMISLCTTQFTSAQEETKSELYQSIIKMDAILFNDGFNKCLLKEMSAYISDDLEFYHDKGGITNSKEAFMTAMQNNICSNWDKKPIRKLTENNNFVFPLYKDGILYGAIQNGVHEFYIKEANKELYLTSTAKFTHVWLLENEKWQIKRVLSYDHQAPQRKEKTAITLSNSVLKEYIGLYNAPQSGKVTITLKGQGLEMNAGEMRLDILPETKNLFFNEQAPLTFEFIKDTKGTVTKLIIRENGAIVEEAKRGK